MMKNELQKIMFLDIETVPQTSDFSELPEDLAHLWEEKFNLIHKRMPEKYSEETTAAEGFNTSAGIYSEFGKIVCISVGFIFFQGETMHFRTKSFCGDDEKEILTGFTELIHKFCITKEHTLCGHNIKEFDIPYICRRMLINGLKLPSILNISGKKPWDITFIDTLELWKFGDYKNYTALKLLTAVFGIPTPKDDIDGSQVAGVYYKEKNVNRIAQYCQKDVVATAQVFLRLNGLELIDNQNIQFI
ncbi:3'-5' exonuclease, PolB [Paludibacter propionicigenes WB4]|uniref:3'-5' exonuclease, PolB n=1 Tax=Paludibacter propionicigenes (strain DSM 17365 / JCM 13257 / WB4) TaxID=694427 RepID=E4T3Q2_PALPW|nr:3'-5' exonuclease [Paludibacter propionicigenes]ADQ79346.1 3'-5' exonuclease, PolB [Paludibacter propionicigenes WB4]